MRALYRTGFASQPESLHRHDGLRLHEAYMSAVCRCAPPDNKPTPEERLRCRPFLIREMSTLSRVRAVLALGRIALDGYRDALISAGHIVSRFSFSHGAEHSLPGGLPKIFVSYHPSRQNTQTGRLTPSMMNRVLRRINDFLEVPR